MRIDVLSIFPEYLVPLDLSLIGKSRERGLLDVRAHNLRDWTTDRHNRVDDTPYGGGAGMVMKPEPWAQGLDAVADDIAGNHQGDLERPILIVPGPSGQRFTQKMAAELAQAPNLVFACGRYEGIDERVYDFATQRYDVRIVSLGDYVLNGGEVAVLAMVEAIVRLVPGVIGNQESLVEESHEDGLLEYPVYTKPAVWRDRGVPEILLSGNHAAIRTWRHEQRLERTAARRPDLLSATQSLRPQSIESSDVQTALPADAGELLTLTVACYVAEGRDHDSFGLPALNETTESVREALAEWTTWVLRSQGRMIGSVRARMSGHDWEIGRLIVAPDLQSQGIGRWLLELAESQAPEEARSVVLFTGAKSKRNLTMYRKAGYRVTGASEHLGVPTKHLAKRISR